MDVLGPKPEPEKSVQGEADAQGDVVDPLLYLSHVQVQRLMQRVLPRDAHISKAATGTRAPCCAGFALSPALASQMQ